MRTRGPLSWRSLLADPDRQWRPGHSAMAAAQRWEAGFPPEVARLCGDRAELQFAIVEHKIPMPGRGFASQCDVFALVHADGRDMAVAVEAKVGEPFGPTVGEWLGNAPSENKQERIHAMAAWLGLEGALGGLRYQLIHRSAAAVVEARRLRRSVAAMIVQSFSPDHAWFDDFRAFAGALGQAAGINAAGETRLPDGLTLRLGWAQGDAKYLGEAT